MAEVVALKGATIKETGEEEEQNMKKKKKRKHDGDDDGDSSAEVVSWERILPRMVLRVLLVEPDHSTRQIIAALLRKCSYTVTAVPDGLKAWETLKRKAPDLDLILTEVQLPAISGFALLTLIMEHDFSKNIPVIMMSSHDSVSMVLKCMLKGAADFLIKPVRRNELRNLWQHVWRRHAISRPPQNTLSQKKLQTASEDNSATNQSSGSMASSQNNNECSEKLSEARSTCTSPVLEAESAYMENMLDAVKFEESTKFEREMAKHDDETGEKSITFVLEAVRFSKTFKSTDLRLEQGHDCAKTKNEDEVVRARLSRDTPNIYPEINGSSDKLVEPSRGAINLIAASENVPKCTNENCNFSGDNTVKFDSDTQLELSLRRDSSRSSCKQASQATEERQRLNRSNTSAFSWYSGSKLLQPLCQTPPIISAEVSNADWGAESHKLSKIVVDTCCRYGGTNQNQENMATLGIGEFGQVGPTSSNSQYVHFPGSGFNIRSRGHDNVFPSVLYAQSRVHGTWNSKACQKESSPFRTSTSSQSNLESLNSEQHYHWSDDATYNSLDQNVHGKSNVYHGRLDSPVAGQSAGSSLRRDATNCINSAYGSTGNGSDGNATSTVLSTNNPKSFSNSGCHDYDGFRDTNSHHSSQREEALKKFRLKRKERCYEKKVRYQSRKRLAEQRPRVKGQFVRQVHNDLVVADAGVDS